VENRSSSPVPVLQDRDINRKTYVFKEEVKEGKEDFSREEARSTGWFMTYALLDDPCTPLESISIYMSSLVNHGPSWLASGSCVGSLHEFYHQKLMPDQVIPL
jgi:hypothetical protein